MKVCITGICGFLGSHLADELIAHGYEVCGIDNLDPQVHGESGDPPAYLNPKVEFVCADVCDLPLFNQSPQGFLRDVDAVVHLAARVGVGQSAYEMAAYVGANSYGTANLLEQLSQASIKKLIVASSMSVYGEGPRDLDYMRVSGGDEMPVEGEPVATSEDHPPDLQSIYALTKYDQERLCLLWGRAYNVPTIALRLFNCYGPRQSLSNPYTGAVAIFASRLLNGKPPIIYEDGYQSRDFVYVSDVVKGIQLALESEVADEVINIGTGTRVTILTLAEGLSKELSIDILPEVTGQHRVGDIRHCWADISKARELLGYEPEVGIVEGIRRLVPWLREQVAVDRVEEHKRELEERGLLR